MARAASSIHAALRKSLSGVCFHREMGATARHMAKASMSGTKTRLKYGGPTEIFSPPVAAS